LVIVVDWRRGASVEFNSAGMAAWFGKPAARQELFVGFAERFWFVTGRGLGIRGRCAKCGVVNGSGWEKSSGCCSQTAILSPVQLRVCPLNPAAWQEFGRVALALLGVR
jgi:hypothetical protein